MTCTNVVIHQAVSNYSWPLRSQMFLCIPIRVSYGGGGWGGGLGSLPPPPPKVVTVLLINKYIVGIATGQTILKSTVKYIKAQLDYSKIR